MSNYYSDFVQFLKNYCNQKGLSTTIEDKLSVLSLDSEHNRKFLSSTKDLSCISMDNIAHDIVRYIAFPNSKWEKDSPASVDSFLIDKNGLWYFIEFKNQKLNKTKYKCIEKTYANIFWLSKILIEMKKFQQILNFDYENPFSFFKNNCIFILVIGNGCDDNSLLKYRECKKAGLDLPENCEFLKKLETYIFKKTLLYNENQFDEHFVKKFEY